MFFTLILKIKNTILKIRYNYRYILLVYKIKIFSKKNTPLPVSSLLLEQSSYIIYIYIYIYGVQKYF